MKVTSGVTLLQGMALIANACPGGYVPNHYMLRVVNNAEVDDETRQQANASVMHSQTVFNRRGNFSLMQAQSNGFIPTGDDNNFPEEQSPQDQAALQQEKETFLMLDEQPPEPGLVERALVEPLRRFARRWTGGDLHEKLAPRQASQADRYIFSNRGTSCIKNEPDLVLVRTAQSGQAIDNSIEQIYTNLGIVDNLFRNVYGRNGIDNRGARYQSIGHFCTSLVNAFWDGDGMLFGDADGFSVRINGFAEVLDVAGHEITHGVIQNSNPLQYLAQSGALNEHLSDVFGTLAMQYYLGQTVSQATWLLGETLVLPGNQPFRSMSAPGTAFSNSNMGNDDQRANMADYYSGPDDFQGVHINSGIPNRAFYLFANSFGTGERAWQRCGQIWYNVLTGSQGQFDYSGETFRTFAQRTINEADRLYGVSQFSNALVTAWENVGVFAFAGR